MLSMITTTITSAEAQNLTYQPLFVNTNYFLHIFLLFHSFHFSPLHNFCWIIKTSDLLLEFPLLLFFLAANLLTAAPSAPAAAMSSFQKEESQRLLSSPAVAATAASLAQTRCFLLFSVFVNLGDSLSLRLWLLFSHFPPKSHFARIPSIRG